MQSSLDRFLRKGKLQLKVTVVKRKNVKKRNQRQQKLRKTRAPGSVTKKRGNKRAEHFDRSGKKHLRGFSSTRLNRKCSVLLARNFFSLADKNSSFFTGSQAFHIGNIKAHASNQKHEACVLARQQREQQERGSWDIVQSLRQMLSDTEEKMKKLFNISYFIAKHERPFSDFEDLCKHHVKNGLSLWETYINDKGCRVFVEAIDGVMKEDESQQVNK